MTSRIEQLFELRQQGKTLQQIGDQFGIVRERVRQLLDKHYGTTKITQFLSTSELAEQVSLSETTILYLQKKGIIRQANDSRKRKLWSSSAVATILSYYPSRKCKICGSILPKQCPSYCSPECTKIGTYKVQKRGAWRRLRLKKGQPLTPSIDYIRPPKNILKEGKIWKRKM